MIVTTSAFKMNMRVFNTLFKLFQEFNSCEDVSSDEFIRAKLLASEQCNLINEEIEKFVLLVNHKNFLWAIKNNFVKHHNLRNYNEMKIVMIIFLIIFGSEGGNAENLADIFKEIKCAFKQKLLEYFCDENNLIATALTGCKFFEDEYVLNKIINPVLNNNEIFQKILEHLGYERANKYPKKALTIPEHLNVLQRAKRLPTVPLNTPRDFPSFQAKDVPTSTYMPDVTEKKLIGEYEKNKLKAKQLLAKAQALSKNYCKPRAPVIVEEVCHPQFKAKKPPQRKRDVQIKGNVTTVLREGNLCIKEQEKEIQNIEDILKGGFTLERYKELEESARQIEHQKFLDDIERKHLEGLLTFEESILAKKRLLEANKERFKQFMEERDTFLRKIEQWRLKEQEKIKMLVKKGQDIERNAKESEKKLRDEKRNQVNQFKDERKKLLQDAYEKQKEELAKKVKLIEEIKTLHQLNSLHVKEFDPTETPNLGLLCQMSIAELQNKLASMKIKMREELEQKRRCIRKYKERQKQMIENVKHFVEQTKKTKPKQKTVPIQQTKLARSSDLDKLKSQLENVRRLRKSTGT